MLADSPQGQVKRIVGQILEGGLPSRELSEASQGISAPVVATIRQLQSHLGELTALQGGARGPPVVRALVALPGACPVLIDCVFIAWGWRACGWFNWRSARQCGAELRCLTISSQEIFCSLACVLNGLELAYKNLRSLSTAPLPQGWHAAMLVSPRQTHARSSMVGSLCRQAASRGAARRRR